MAEKNLQEYYGRIPSSDEDPDESLAFLTVLMSYEYATETIRLHFNMKEPGHLGSVYYAETDIQWNTHLDMRSAVDRMMVNTDDNEISLKHMVTVYGYSQEMITMHKNCNFDLTLKEKDG